MFLAAATAVPAVPRGDLAREVLRRVPEWPGTQVEVPLNVYEQYVRFLLKGPTPPQPPEVTWLERTAYTIRIGPENAVDLLANLEVVRLPGEGGRSLHLLPADLAWRDVTVNGRPTELRSAADGWMHFDPAGPGRYRVVATASPKVTVQGAVRHIEFGTPPAAWRTGAVASKAAWHVRFSQSPLPVVGTAEGTQGVVGLVPGGRLAVTWQPPRPPVHRAAQVEAEAHVGWTLADGVHQIRAVLDLRLWGGETEQVAIALPEGADRVRITGPDVREVRLEGPQARVFLRGPVRQRTRLNISFEAPRPPTGHMTLPTFGVVGARQRGGTLAIAGGGGAVLLEMDSPGLAPMALYDLPDATRALLSAPPVYAYTLSGSWEARVDLVSMAEFPVRETLVDSALYTVLYRPDGQVMTKALYQVRNRAQQYMTVDLPAGARLVVARVSEEQTSLARGPGTTIYVPLEKSVLTTAGLVSFPVEIVTMMRAEPLGAKGRFQLPLPRIDLPVAYARCALMLPEGMRTRQWHGPLQRTDAWSSETAELEFEYGRGHLVAGPSRGPESKPEPMPEGEPAGEPEAPPPAPAQPDPTRQPPDPDETPTLETVEFDLPEPLAKQQQMLQGKNLYRAGLSFYQRQDYEKAQELFEQTAEVAPKSVEAANAMKYISNIEVALGTDVASKGERGVRATAKAVQKAQQHGNIDVRRRQEELLGQARLAIRAGDKGQAEAAYRVAVNLSGQLQKRGEERQEQKALLREAEAYLSVRQRQREKNERDVEALEKQVTGLKERFARASGKEAADAIGFVLYGDEPATAKPPTTSDAEIRLKPTVEGAEQTAPQIELGKAWAEQQVAAGTLRGAPPGAARVADHDRYFEDQAARVEVLKKQLSKLSTAYKQLRGTVADDSARSEGGRPAGTAGDDRKTDKNARWDVTDASASVDFGEEVASRTKDLKAEVHRVTELTRAGRLAEAERLATRLEKKAKATETAAITIARHKRASSNRGGVGTMPKRPSAEGTEAGASATVEGFDDEVDLASDRRPDRKPGPASGKPSAGAGVADVQTVLGDITKARTEIQARARELERTKFNVDDIAKDERGRQLAEFVRSNYTWELNAPVNGRTITFQNGQAVQTDRPIVGSAGGEAGGHSKARAFYNYHGYSIPDQPPAQVTYETDGDALVVSNRPVAVKKLGAVLDQLRQNLGQRVAVASRNVFLDAHTARAAGIRWKAGANGVHYAVINEGQLLAMMDVEQRAPSATAQAGRFRDAYQEAIVGTQALLANDLPVTISRAADEDNSLTYAGNTLRVAHDDYLLVDNGSYLTAVKSGRMQHWSVEAEPVRFPGVPAAVVVPAVGYTLKFEKTLLDPSDSTELVAEYTWEGEE